VESSEKGKLVLPSYDNPPVNEVVCGLTFKSIDKLLAPHVGVLWLKYKDEYPACREVPPLAPTIERFDDSPPESPTVELHDVPPLPRIWFIHSNDNGVVQLQRDRFLHNWRKVRPDDEYPRYHSVKKMFQEKFAVFEAFLEEMQLGVVHVRQCEMTYINHIPKGEGWQSAEDVPALFPDFAWRKDTRFLKIPSDFHWRTVFLLPERQGRLHVTVRFGRRKQDSQPI
jgi:uncharacterized protein (TIGR04255 family)